ncbi:MAG TPA: VOC family protein [Candidatus Acidoferrum sp.]|nr:VOC family protein [Candidatus Acidoferrum sp.]
MRLNPHLQFDGHCESAFKFYAQCLGGRIVVMMTYGESPGSEQIQAEWRNRILHTTLAVGDYLLQGADVPPESYQRPRGFSVMLNIEDAAAAERIFNSLSQNGVVQMPLQETFWAIRFGMLTDQFGTPWTINCGKPR